MILFLDDDENRTRTFQSNAPQAECVETAQEMIDLLQARGGASLLFLDHDLGHETFVSSDREDCGMEVVRWMVKNLPKVGQVVVHTCNGPAAVRMVEDLEKAGYNTVGIPFIALPWDQIQVAAERIYAGKRE